MLSYKSSQFYSIYGTVLDDFNYEASVNCWIIQIKFCLIFFSLDRLILAIIFTIYLLIGCKTDEGDYSYHKAQYSLKCQELHYLENWNQIWHCKSTNIDKIFFFNVDRKWFVKKVWVTYYYFYVYYLFFCCDLAIFLLKNFCIWIIIFYSI